MRINPTDERPAPTTPLQKVKNSIMSAHDSSEFYVKMFPRLRLILSAFPAFLYFFQGAQTVTQRKVAQHSRANAQLNSLKPPKVTASIA
jgi:hypothetical protein